MVIYFKTHKTQCNDITVHEVINTDAKLIGTKKKQKKKQPQANSHPSKHLAETK